jgi:hypothetical protein
VLVLQLLSQTECCTATAYNYVNRENRYMVEKPSKTHQALPDDQNNVAGPPDISEAWKIIKR